MKETEQEKETPKRGRILGIFRANTPATLSGKYKWNYLIGILILIFIDIKQTDVPIIVGDSINAIDARNLPAGFISGQVLRLAIIAAIVFVGRIAWRWFIFGSARKDRAGHAGRSVFPPPDPFSQFSSRTTRPVRSWPI